MPVYDEPIPDYGDLFTVSEFRECVDSGLFIDDDGVGSPVKDELVDGKISIYPSEVDHIPEDATHIVWFNK